jgi:hypothetical protein
MKPILIYDSPITSIGDAGDHAREVAEYICDLNSEYERYTDIQHPKYFDNGKRSSWEYSEKENGLIAD